MRIILASDGTPHGTKITDAAGLDVQGVKAVTWMIKVDEPAKAFLELSLIELQATEVEAQAVLAGRAVRSIEFMDGGVTEYGPAAAAATEGKLGPGCDTLWFDAPLDIDMWGVYGPACFPRIFSCRMVEARGYRALWGFSHWKGAPGFRTLGVGVDWAERHDLRLFLTFGAAAEFIAGQFVD